MKRLLSFSFSKVYVIAMILISLLVVGSYFSYAMFTVSKERSNAISIVTGNLIYDLTVDEEDIESLVVPANTTMEFIVVLSNPNNRIARFNFYYLGNLPDGVSAGYMVEENFNIPPEEVGINLEKNGTSGSSNTYKIKVTNASASNVTINLGVSVGLDYNDLTLPSNGHLFEEYSAPLADVLLVDKTNNINKNDSEQYFITGQTPNNYIWYSGKLWRAVSVDSSDNSVKLVTQENMTVILYDYRSSYAFDGSQIEMWLNDTTVDGFLYNLRDYENFIKLDTKWNATMTTSTAKPAKTTMVEDPVGLLNIYEYTMSYSGTTYSNGYLNTRLYSWLLSPSSQTKIWGVTTNGSASSNEFDLTTALGVRPVINLKSNINTNDGDGTKENPYRLEGDNDKDLNGVKLNTRYSGEYIRFGNEPNNLYRIVSHEVDGLTKITSATPLKTSSGSFVTSAFGSNSTFSSTNTIGTFLNGTYLNSYLTAGNRNMIVTNNTWYLGTVMIGPNYRLAKYTDINMSGLTSKTSVSTVGLLRHGELLSSQLERDGTTSYYLINPNTSNHLWVAAEVGSGALYTSTTSLGVKPSLNLKENVIITGGDGTKNNPFTLSGN